MKANREKEDQVVLAVQSGTLSVDSQGRIWRHKRRGWDNGLKRGVDRPCAPVRAESDPKNGYLQVQLRKNNLKSIVQAHRVVYRVLIGEIPPGLTINHKNGLKSDNRPENLELATYSEQIKHAKFVLGHYQLRDGENNNMAKLTEEAVRQIRQRRSSGESLKSIGLAFGVSESAIWRVVKKLNWASVT